MEGGDDIILDAAKKDKKDKKEKKAKKATKTLEALKKSANPKCRKAPRVQLTLFNRTFLTGRHPLRRRF